MIVGLQYLACQGMYRLCLNDKVLLSRTLPVRGAGLGVCIDLLCAVRLNAGHSCVCKSWPDGDSLGEFIGRTCDSQSMEALSVSTSASESPAPNSSPTFTFHATMLPAQVSQTAVTKSYKPLQCWECRNQPLCLVVLSLDFSLTWLHGGRQRGHVQHAVRRKAADAATAGRWRFLLLPA